jgi:hypothetical protein
MNSFGNNVVTEKIGDGIELYIEGIPQSTITPAAQAQAALSLMQYGIPMGAHFTEGIIGSTGNATLKIGKSYYKIKYAFRAMRAITALEIYSQAIDYIEYRKSKGQVDSILADGTISYLRQSLRQEQQKWLREQG